MACCRRPILAGDLPVEPYGPPGHQADRAEREKERREGGSAEDRRRCLPYQKAGGEQPEHRSHEAIAEGDRRAGESAAFGHEESGTERGTGRQPDDRQAGGEHDAPQGPPSRPVGGLWLALAWYRHSPIMSDRSAVAGSAVRPIAELSAAFDRPAPRPTVK